jgi:hypothetical protein
MAGRISYESFYILFCRSSFVTAFGPLKKESEGKRLRFKIMFIEIIPAGQDQTIC